MYLAGASPANAFPCGNTANLRRYAVDPDSSVIKAFGSYDSSDGTSARRRTSLRHTRKNVAVSRPVPPDARTFSSAARGFP